MKNKSTNNDKKFDIFSKKFTTSNNEAFLDLNQKNYCNIGIINDINSYENSSLFPDDHALSEFNFVKHEEINIMPETISNDILNTNKIGLKENSNIINNEANKEEIDEKKKYSLNYLIRRAKKIIFDLLLKYDNDVISRVYNNNIGYGINIRKILKIKHFLIQNTNTNYNNELLRTSQGIIFSSDISTRYTNYPINHNKLLINRLLNEENDQKRKIFQDLFSKTLLECIENLVGKRKSESLKGIEKYYEKEMMVLDEEEKFKELLKKIINDLKIIFENKKPRKKKSKKK